ncbi:uncharacterized protein CBL_09274 [Carabus blaptoides fortunei]
MDSLAFGTQVLVHLDLKGAPPRISYFEKFFPFLREIGITGILLEWEDTFPYTKELMSLGGLSYGALASGSPYSIEDAKQILQIAADCGLTVIPLLQTFGHFEFVLKHEQWRCLREVEAYPSSMCPLKSGTMPLIRSLIKQIIAFHPDIQYIHIGADEVWHLGLCPECSRKAQSSKHGKASLFLDHVTSVAQYIKDNFPNLKIIMWDDMLRNIDITALQEYFIGNLVEPMVWHYNNKQTFSLGYTLWEKYSNIFSHIWGASAFKGASGSCQIVPVNKHYVENHEAWLSELGVHGSKIHSFRGIVLTGWSRYDHYATLCELLPTAVPSLALCLKTWQSGGYTQQIHDSVSKFLGYTEPPLYLQSPIRPYSIAHELSFPGWQILVGVEWFVNIKAKYRNIVDSDQVQTWFNQWQILNNYTNPMQIESILPVLTELLLEVTTLENFLKTNLDMFFFPSTAEEFLGTWLTPIKQQISQLKCDCETQISIGCRVRVF